MTESTVCESRGERERERQKGSEHQQSDCVCVCVCPSQKQYAVCVWAVIYVSVCVHTRVCVCSSLLCWRRCCHWRQNGHNRAPSWIRMRVWIPIRFLVGHKAANGRYPSNLQPIVCPFAGLTNHTESNTDMLWLAYNLQHLLYELLSTHFNYAKMLLNQLCKCL